jgi:hypothetical protein
MKSMQEKKGPSCSKICTISMIGSHQCIDADKLKQEAQWPHRSPESYRLIFPM